MAPARIAIVSNEQTPYRLHLHRRIVAELPEVELWSLFTHEVASSPWKQREAAEIRPVWFGSGDSTAAQARIGNALREWRKGGAILGWLEEHRIEGVVVLGYNDAGRLRIIRRLRERGIPCFLFGDSNILCDASTGGKAALKRAILPRILRLCSGTLYCGRLGREYFLRYGVAPARTFPFPYEPDYERVQNIGDDVIRDTRSRFGLTARRHLMHSGRLAAVKRVDLLLDAFSSIAPQRPEWNLIVAGDGPLREALRARVPERLRERVIWTGFIDGHDTLAGLYANADALVLPSDYEPWGVVVTEAAVRLALVTSSVVGAGADLTRDGVNGRVFPAGDRQALAECLLDVTAEDTIDRMKAASPRILADWRREADPVRGLAAALRAGGVLTSTGARDSVSV